MSSLLAVKVVVAVGRSILVVVWRLLSDDQAGFHDLSVDVYDKRKGPDQIKRAHVRQLEALGYRVTLGPTAA